MKNFKNGFTVAEILIVLGVIGILSLLTVSSLINSTDERKYNAKEKQALNFLQSIFDTKILIGRTPGNLFVFQWIMQGDDAYRLKTIDANDNAIETSDNIIFYSTDYASNCLNDTGCTIYVDLNGSKGPSETNLGQDISEIGNRDVVSFTVTRGTVRPNNFELEI